MHHTMITVDIFKDHDRAAPGPLELEDGRGDVELAPDGLAYAHQLVWVSALDHRQEGAHALRVHRVFLLSREQTCN